MPSAKSRKSSVASPAEIPQQSSQQITPRLLTIPQAATYLSATVWSVRELLWSNTIPHAVIGRRHLIDRADLDRYIDTQLSNSARHAKSIANRIARLTQQVA
jgi:excisionase family DNA binding protein